MKQILLVLLLGIVFCYSCEEEPIDFGSGSENESIVGTWNLNAIRFSDCGEFDVVLRELGSSDTTFFFIFDSTFVDTFEIDPVLGDTSFFQQLIVDTTFQPQSGVDSVTIDSLPQIEPITGQTIGYLQRYTRVPNDNALFDVDYQFDTVFVMDYIEHFDACESVYEFKDGGSGELSQKLFEGAKETRSLRWTDNSDGTFEICVDGDCSVYVATISSEGGMVLRDNGFDANDCNRADLSFYRAPSYAGSYSWSSAELFDCRDGSTTQFDNLMCDVEADNPVVASIGAVCYSLNLNCDGTGNIEIKEGPNDGNYAIIYSEIGNNRLILNFSGNQGNSPQIDLEVLGDNNVRMNLESVTTLDRKVCNFNIDFSK